MFENVLIFGNIKINNGICCMQCDPWVLSRWVGPSQGSPGAAVRTTERPRPDRILPSGFLLRPGCRGQDPDPCGTDPALPSGAADEEWMEKTPGHPNGSEDTAAGWKRNTGYPKDSQKAKRCFLQQTFINPTA